MSEEMKDMFTCTVKETARPMSVTEEIQCEDVSSCEKLDAIVENDGTPLLIECTNFVTMAVHNPKSRRNTDYEAHILCVEGGAYYTGSETLAESVRNIYNKLKQHGVNIEKTLVTFAIKKYPAQNYPGNYFMKASLAGYSEQ